MHQKIEDMTDEEKVFAWGLLALSQLQEMGLVNCQFQTTQLGTSFFDQLDAVFRPSNRELSEFIFAIPMPDGYEQTRRHVHALLATYRDNRELFYQWMETQRKENEEE